MKILSLRLKNLNSLKGEWKIDFTREPFASNGLLLLPAQQVRGKPPCWTPFVWRCITKLRVSLTFHNRKMIS
ncbi:exonuclease subunit SbcC [Shigella sonnei]|nr:exonuclease subunit SbcC [Shigella sonnei]